MTKSMIAVFLTLALSPPVAVAQGRGQSKGAKRNSQGIPPGHLPPVGECRVWYEGVPPGRQPAPTSCRSAEATARQTRSARVIYGDDRDRSDARYRDNDRWSDDRDRRDDGRDDDWQNGRAIPRDSYPRYPESSQGRRTPDAWFPDARDQQHPGWSAGYRDGLVKGREDASKNRSYDPTRHQWYRSASRGYDRRYGLRGGYANVYREGFETGYAEEFRRSGSRR